MALVIRTSGGTGPFDGGSPSHGWAIGEPREYPDAEAQNHEDAEALYRVLADEIVPVLSDEAGHRLDRGNVREVEIGADGTVWLLAIESDARYPILHTYVITLEAVAAAE